MRSSRALCPPPSKCCRKNWFDSGSTCQRLPSVGTTESLNSTFLPLNLQVTTGLRVASAPVPVAYWFAQAVRADLKWVATGIKAKASLILYNLSGISVRVLPLKIPNVTLNSTKHNQYVQPMLGAPERPSSVARVMGSFPDRFLRRTAPNVSFPSDVQSIHKELPPLFFCASSPACRGCPFVRHHGVAGQRR